MADNGPIYSRHSGKVASLQLIYNDAQVAHLLKKSRGQVRNLMKEGKLDYRYELKTGWSVSRVSDYFMVWKYIDNYLPRPSDLASNKLNPTMRAIARILEWERAGQRQAKFSRDKKAEKQGRQTGSEI